MRQFLSRDIWRIEREALTRRQFFWLRQLRIFVLAVKGFDEDKCQLRASALTFFTLLSVVPVMAMAFGVAKGFGLQQRLESLIFEKFAGQEEVITRLVTFSHNMLQNTKGGVIAGIGVVFIFWLVIRVLGQIENAFNEIWGIQRGRSLARKFSDYLSVMLIAPVLLIMTSGLNVLITTQVENLMEETAFLGAVSPVIVGLLGLLPYVMVWMLFTLICSLMPNTRVALRSALFGGIVAGTLYQIVQWVYITFQVGAAKYGAVYGSFAALPLFLIWLQVSWLTLLFGGELSFAHQHIDTYDYEPEALNVSRSLKKLVNLRIAHLCVQNFVAGRPALTQEEIRGRLKIPSRLAQESMFELTESGVLAEVKKNGSDMTAYQPATDPERLTIQEVISRLEHRGGDNIPLESSRDMEKIREHLQEFDAVLTHSPVNKSLKAI